MTPSRAPLPIRPLSRVAGAALGGAARVAGAVRPAPKPLHPRGLVRLATLRRHGLQPPVGVDFLDATATDQAVVRESRATGLPRPLPDVHGLALRVPNPDGTHSDILFATTGTGRLTRFLFKPTRSPHGPAMTTLLPYATAIGPVLLSLRAVGGRRLELSFAVGGGPWRAFGELELSERGPDEDLSFDAVAHPPPGLEQYPTVRRLRAPAYAAARRSRGEG